MNSRARNVLTLGICASVCLCSLAQEISAATREWDAYGQPWRVRFNWVGDILPQSSDTALIANGGSVSLISMIRQS